jgi:hypothetical protein
LKAGLLAVFAVCVVSAAAAASASALEFYVEHKLITGLLNIDSVLHSKESILKGELSGVKVEISCLELHNTGWIHNGLSPSGVLLGLGLIEVHFLKCTVPVPASEHCKVVNELILATSLVDLGTIGGETYALFSPDPPGSPFVKITFEGCKQTALNTSFPVTGEAVGLASNPGLLIFKEGAPNNKLKFASNTATLIAEDLVLMEGTGSLIEAL